MSYRSIKKSNFEENREKFLVDLLPLTTDQILRFDYIFIIYCESRVTHVEPGSLLLYQSNFNNDFNYIYSAIRKDFCKIKLIDHFYNRCTQFTVKIILPIQMRRKNDIKDQSNFQLQYIFTGVSISSLTNIFQKFIIR